MDIPTVALLFIHMHPKILQYQITQARHKELHDEYDYDHLHPLQVIISSFVNEIRLSESSTLGVSRICKGLVSCNKLTHNVPLVLDIQTDI